MAKNVQRKGLKSQSATIENVGFGVLGYIRIAEIPGSASKGCRWLYIYPCDLADEPVEVGVARSLDVVVAAADIVDRLVVDHEGAVDVLEGGLGAQRRVVGLHHGSGHLGQNSSFDFLP